eukprot:974617-Amphidinium_carterae.1
MSLNVSLEMCVSLAWWVGISYTPAFFVAILAGVTNCLSKFALALRSRCLPFRAVSLVFLCSAMSGVGRVFGAVEMGKLAQLSTLGAKLQKLAGNEAAFNTALEDY